MAQGVLPFKYEAEKNDTGMTSLGGLPVYLDLMHVIGLSESIMGLYRRCSTEQKEKADKWLMIAGLAENRNHPFDQLSYGERRMVHLAQAMVKPPELLIMDEPCQGLDPENRLKILSIVEQICNRTATNLLYITHLRKEIPPGITHVLNLTPQS